MKRFLSLFLISLLFLPLLSFALGETEMQEGSMYVFTPNGRSLHFRATKDTSEDNIICEIPYGAKVYVVSWDNTWARIQYQDSYGFVVKRFLQTSRPADYAEIKAEAEQKKTEQQERQELRERQKALDHSKVKALTPYDVTVQLGIEDGATNFYQGPSLLSDILQVCPDGARLVVTAQNRDWARVYDGAADLEGYVLLTDLIPDEVEEEVLD